MSTKWNITKENQLAALQLERHTFYSKEVPALIQWCQLEISQDFTEDMLLNMMANADQIIEMLRPFSRKG